MEYRDGMTITKKWRKHFKKLSGIGHHNEEEHASGKHTVECTAVAI
jgi:hypothetical protein